MSGLHHVAPDNHEREIAVVLATGNEDKVREIKPLIQQLSSLLNVCSLADLSLSVEIEETEKTLEGNARLKASAIYAMLEAGFRYFIVLADDTGLEVNALDGAPGVYSARFAPVASGTLPTYEENVEYLLRMMHGAGDRSAVFRTVIALKGRIPSASGHISVDETAEGVVAGRITSEKKGSLGFGYDPVFHVTSAGKTYAEMTIQEKNSVSHRGLAINNAVDIIHAKLEQSGIPINHSMKSS
jgi:XTP/dITP diphosphohydrolase